MDIREMIQTHEANKADALARFAAQNGGFEVGGNALARGRRPQVQYKQRMVNQGDVGRLKRRARSRRAGRTGAATSQNQQHVMYVAEQQMVNTAPPTAHCPVDSVGPPTGMGCDTQPPCGVNVIGGNTLSTPGIAPGLTRTVTITAGDAGYFQPRAVYFEAHEVNNNDTITTANLAGGCCSWPIILIDVLIGRISMLRRGGSADRGLIQGGFANTKELVAVDWGEFVSTNEQNLSLVFYNPNAAVTVHGFVDIWGNI